MGPLAANATRRHFLRGTVPRTNPPHDRRQRRQCSTEIRTASYLLHPPLLDEIGLLSALRWLADGLRQRSGIQIELELPESLERLPPEHELAIFRVAQEALTNVHRHSKSPSVTIRLFEQDGALFMEVADAGHGILVGGPSGRMVDV